VNHHWELPDDLSASASARQRVRSALEIDGVREGTRDDAELIASELAANAVRYGAPPYTLALDVTADRIRITVSDHGSTADPRVTDAAHDAGNGRGLAMIAAVAEDLGWHREGDRLDVWADLSLVAPGD